VCVAGGESEEGRVWKYWTYLRKGLLFF